MDRITLDLGAVASLPTPPTQGDAGGHFTNGTPGSVNATEIPDWWLDMVQEELRALLVAAGLTPDRTNTGQVAQAVQTISAAQVVPAGTVIYYAGTTPPTGYLAANGAAFSRTTYANLYTAIGTTFGAGDGATTANLPDLRGQFIRGFDNGRGVDPSRTFGSTQAYAVQSHTHGVNDSMHSHGITDPSHFHDIPTQPGTGQGATGGANTVEQNSGTSNTYYAFTGITINYSATGISIQATGSTETRPTNIAMLACIKY